MGPVSAEGCRRPWPSFAAALGGALLALTGCVTSGYTYVANDDLGTYFKVPDDYTIFDNQQVMALATEDLPADVRWSSRRTSATPRSRPPSLHFPSWRPSGSPAP